VVAAPKQRAPQGVMRIGKDSRTLSALGHCQHLPGRFRCFVVTRCNKVVDPHP
jgi:hypothetical protein